MKIIKILLVLLALTFYSPVSYADDTKLDCTNYTHDTLKGSFDKWRCERGKGELKLELGKKVKNLFKKGRDAGANIVGKND